MSKQTISIGNKKIGERQPVFIIAEAGVNHNGQLPLALKLIDAAKEAGADAVKFQTWRVEQVVTKMGKMAEYQKRNTGRDESQFDMLKRLELKEGWYPKLISRAKKRGIILLSAPHGGFEAVDLMERFNFPAFKISSGDLTNLPLLEYVAKKEKPILISTGMATLAEVKEAVKIVRKTGNDQILVFQCTTDYPLSPEDANLRVIETFSKEMGVLVGYSDHTIGDEAAIMAVTLGAVMIEKHLTLDSTMPGPDHIASMEPKPFKEMVKKLRLVPMFMGDGIKKSREKEKQYITVARKSIVAACHISKGEIFTKENLAIKRPGTGILPKMFSRLVGKRAKQNIFANTLLTKRMF